MPTLFAMCACKATLLCLMLQANAGRTWPSWFLHSHQGCTRLLHLLQTHSSTCKKLRSLKFWNIFHNKVRITNLGTRRATPFPFSSLFLPFFSPSPSSFFLSFSSGPQTAIFCLKIHPVKIETRPPNKEFTFLLSCCSSVSPGFGQCAACTQSLLGREGAATLR